MDRADAGAGGQFRGSILKRIESRVARTPRPLKSNRQFPVNRDQCPAAARAPRQFCRLREQARYLPLGIRNCDRGPLSSGFKSMDAASRIAAFPPGKRGSDPRDPDSFHARGLWP